MKSVSPAALSLSQAQKNFARLVGTMPCHVIVLTKPDEVLRAKDGKPEPTTEAELVKSIEETSDRWTEVQALCGQFSREVAKAVLPDVLVTVVDMHVRTMEEGNPRRDDEENNGRIADRCVDAVITVLRSAQMRTA
jgi:hypothetical protein